MLSHFKHRYLVVTVEDRLQFSVSIDHAFVFLVLQTVCFDVSPKFLNNLAAWHWLVASYFCER